ncbi:hypothetical protein [Labrenzia sp. PHM005]|uniref:hypothetical protein n=1 Tax=Labrenzia sp. PHM005 TaxID=2590016 RepID=UPI00114084CC|nr:hypothetical protein [Labrenzia sp. PHM005]QDG77690.1 hypothetical protein FJ695_18490 [Labrenzia sp. PHM005]
MGRRIGDVTLHGKDGNHTYLFQRSDGVDVIGDNGAWDTDKLVLQGYTAEEVKVTRSCSSSDAVFSLAETADQVTIKCTLEGS